MNQGSGNPMDVKAEILTAAERGDVETARRLLEGDPGLAQVRGDYDKTPLHWAAEKNHRVLAELLLSHGAEIEAEVCWGMTPLQWAANMNSREVAEVLLSHGAVLNLWAAAGLGRMETVCWYWEGPGKIREGAGQARNRQEADGRWVRVPPPESYHEIVSDAFYIASRNGHTPVVRFLLDQGADVNHRGFFGAPGLHWAALNGHQETVLFLLEHGADPNLRDTHFHSTARSWAREGERNEIEQMLKERGGEG